MKRLAISFSGGRSSAVMTRLAVQQYSATHDIVVTFANTGAEHPNTLDFVRDFDRHTGIPVVWIEAEVNPEQGQGTRARIVTHETASRDGRPFEDVVAKYGVPGPGLPQCTSRLKLEPMQAYLRYDLGWEAGSYQTAIGLRADEMDRVNYNGLISGQLIYPLIDAGITKAQVLAVMAQESWDLDLPGEHYGNCVTCWKKSDRKLYTIAQDDPLWFDLFARLERTYGEHKAQGERRVFYRRERAAGDVVYEALRYNFERYEDDRQTSLWQLDPHLDLGGGCGDSCEIYADEEDDQ